MACLVETLGLALPRSAAIPAVHADRLRCAEESGRRAVELIGTTTLLPRNLVTQKSIENAMRVLLAVSGSTNAVVHLAAIARRAGAPLDLHRLNTLSDETPVLVNLKPVGANYMEDFFAAGGVPAVLRELRDLLHHECPTISGKTIGELIDAPPVEEVDRAIIRLRSDPVDPDGGLVAVFGSLAPRGAIVKRAAADKRLLEHEGRAIVFSSLDDLAERIDSPALDVGADDILVLQNAGPRSEVAMPEAGYLPIPRKLAENGARTWSAYPMRACPAPPMARLSCMSRPRRRSAARSLWCARAIESGSASPRGNWTFWFHRKSWRCAPAN
jgi:dihydroxy-acid dehydratase